MKLASNLLLSEGIKQTMEILQRNLSRAELSQYFGQIKKPLKEVSSMFKRYLEEQRGSLFDGYYEKHQNSDLLSCRSADGVQVAFCPSDHSGVWAGDPCVRPPLKLLQDCDRLESSIKGVKNKQPNITTLMTGIVTWICRAPEAKAIRVSYHEGAILSDWIPVDELPALKAEWPPKPCND